MVKKKSKSLMTFGGLEKSYKKEQEKVRQSYLTPYGKKQEKPTLQEKQKQLEKEYKKEKKELVKKKLSGIGKNIQRLSTSKGKRTILRKPTAKVKSVSPQGFISGGLVKQNKDNGNKTGYIKEEMMEDRISWLS